MPERELPESIMNPESKELQNIKQTTAYVNAGGRGTRLEPILNKTEVGITKALIEFKDKPIVQYHVDRLLLLGVHNVIVGAGDHKGVEEYLLSQPAQERLKVALTEHQEGTGGDLIKALRNQGTGDRFVLVQNVDTLLDVDERAVIKQHNDTGAAATIVLTTRKGVPNEGAFLVGVDGKVLYTKESSSLEPSLELVESTAYTGSSTGMVILNMDKVLEYPWESGQGSLSLYGDILGKLVAEGTLYAYNNEDKYFEDVGTPEKYRRIQRHPIIKDILDRRSQ